MDTRQIQDYVCRLVSRGELVALRPLPRAVPTVRPAEAKESEPSEPAGREHYEWVLSAELKTPGGQPLALERIAVINQQTQKQIAHGVTTDKNGRFAMLVPEDGKYDLEIVSDEFGYMYDQAGDAEGVAQLSCQIFLADAQPLSGERVTVTGSEVSFVLVTGDQGEIESQAHPGEYEIQVRGQKFKVHTLYLDEMNYPSSGLYQFLLEGDGRHDGGTSS